MVAARMMSAKVELGVANVDMWLEIEEMGIGLRNLLIS
jgi:hypothetical protein